jgi:hypothetical protein
MAEEKAGDTWQGLRHWRCSPVEQVWRWNLREALKR